MRIIQEVAIGITAALCGLVVWQVISAPGGMQEAWDSPEYYTTGIPVMMLTALVCGFVSSRKPWRWGVAVVALQPVVLYAQGRVGPLVVVGLATFGVIAILCILAAYGGAAVKHVIDRRTPKT
jgi:hypothetical protein